VPTRRIGLLYLALLIITVGVCVIEGTLGSYLRPYDDLRLALGLNAPPSPPEFPLLRDTPSIWFLATIVLTCMLVHRQWLLMSTCIPKLKANGVIRGRRHDEGPVVKRNFAQRRVGKMMRGRSTDEDELDIVLAQVARYIGFFERNSWLPAVCACLLACLLVVGQQKGLFTSIAPDALEGAARSRWLDDTYQSWWASNNHLLGLATYFVVASFGLYVIICQNIVGVVTVYFVIAMFSCAHIDADWTNQDGRHGWRPIAEIFRTVYLSLILHGLALIVILVAIGPAQYVWVFGMLAIWLIVTPLYLLAPYAVFRRVERAAKSARSDYLAGRLVAARQDHDLAREAAIGSMYREMHAARIRPLRFGWSGAAATFTILLTIALWVIQQFLPD